jgi:hypothetical protein
MKLFVFVEKIKVASVIDSAKNEEVWKSQFWKVPSVFIFEETGNVKYKEIFIEHFFLRKEVYLW